MFDLFQTDPSSLMSFAVLIAMCTLSLTMSLLMRRKLRDVCRLPRELPATVFDKTFNVFDPYSERKRILGASSMFPVIIILSSLAFGGFVATKMIEAGMTAGFTILIVCLSMMMFDEASEIRKNADVFVNAVRKGTELGQGDIFAFSVVKKGTAKLFRYYLAMAITLFAGAVALPYLAPFASSAFSRLLAVILRFSTSGGLTTVFLGLAIYSLIISLILMLSNRMKDRFLSFSSQEPKPHA